MQTVPWPAVLFGSQLDKTNRAGFQTSRSVPIKISWLVVHVFVNKRSSFSSLCDQNQLKSRNSSPIVYHFIQILYYFVLGEEKVMILPSYIAAYGWIPFAAVVVVSIFYIFYLMFLLIFWRFPGCKCLSVMNCSWSSCSPHYSSVITKADWSMNSCPPPLLCCLCCSRCRLPRCCRSTFFWFPGWKHRMEHFRYEWWLIQERGGYGVCFVFNLLCVWLIDWLSDGLSDWLIDWLSDGLSDWLIDWVIDWLIDYFVSSNLFFSFQGWAANKTDRDEVEAGVMYAYYGKKVFFSDCEFNSFGQIELYVHRSFSPFAVHASRCVDIFCYTLTFVFTALYALITFMAFVVLPFAYFYYEERDDDRPMRPVRLELHFLAVSSPSAAVDTLLSFRSVVSAHWSTQSDSPYWRALFYSWGKGTSFSALIDWSFDWLIDWSSALLIDWLIDWLTAVNLRFRAFIPLNSDTHLNGTTWDDFEALFRSFEKNGTLFFLSTVKFVGEEELKVVFFAGLQAARMPFLSSSAFSVWWGSSSTSFIRATEWPIGPSVWSAAVAVSDATTKTFVARRAEMRREREVFSSNKIHCSFPSKSDQFYRFKLRLSSFLIPNLFFGIQKKVLKIKKSFEKSFSLPIFHLEFTLWIFVFGFFYYFAW